MENTADDARRIARNTAFMYLRWLLLAAGNLFAVRLVLSALGVESYGMVAAVGAVTAMLVFLNGVLQSTAQRFLSFALGKNEGGDPSDAFAAIAGITLMLCAAILLVGETVGLGFVACRLSVAEGMRPAAMAIYQAGIVHVLLDTLLLPVAALIGATERMGFFVRVSFVEALLSLSAAGALFALPSHRPEAYAALVALKSAIVLLLFVLHGRRLCPNMRWSVKFNISELREQGGYFFWSMLHAAANALKVNGVVLLVNQYAGVVHSASWRIGYEIGSVGGGIYNSFRQAYFPQLVKRWPLDDRRPFRSLTLGACRWSFALTSLFVVPVMVYTDAILALWIGHAPSASMVAFVRCFAVHYLLDSLVEPMHSAVLATGRIARYEVGQFLTIGTGFVFAFIALAAGLPAWTSVAAVAVGAGLNLAYHVVWLKLRLGIAVWRSNGQ